MSLDTRVGFRTLDVLREALVDYINAHTVEREGGSVYIGDPSYIDSYIRIKEWLTKDT